jgi:hypothetical protein
MIPGRDDAPLPGLAAVDTAEFWREYEARAPDLLRFGFRASVWALSLAPPLLLGRVRTFEGLSPAERDELLDKVSRSRSYLIRQLPLTVKLMACFAYLRDDDVRTRVEELSDP